MASHIKKTTGPKRSAQGQYLGKGGSCKQPLIEDQLLRPHAFWNGESHDNFYRFFCCKPMISERFVEPKPILMAKINEHLPAYVWMSLFKLNGLVHEQEVRMFYANIHSKNEANLSLVSEVYRIPIRLNPNILSMELGVPRI